MRQEAQRLIDQGYLLAADLELVVDQASGATDCSRPLANQLPLANRKVLASRTAPFGYR
jgi:hypothetical protein